MEKNRRFRSLKDRIMRKKMFARVVKVLIGIILVFPAQAQEKQQRVSLSVEQQTVVDIFKLLEQQVSYKFLYHDADILKLGKKNLTLKEVLSGMNLLGLLLFLNGWNGGKRVEQ